MSGPTASTGGISGTLTDGTGVSQILASKFVKDLVADILLALPPALIAINVLSLEQALLAPVAVAFAVGDAVIRWLYRAALRWTQS